MKINNNLLIIFLLLLILVVPFISCKNEDLPIKLYDYLITRVSNTVNQLNIDLPRYKTEADKKSEYVANADKLRATLIDLSGSWSFTPYNFTNINNPALNDISIIKMANACTEMRQYDIKLNWSILCENIITNVNDNISQQTALLNGLKSNYKDWTVKEYNNNLYIIEGMGLGFDLSQPVKGQWYWNRNNLTFTPADLYAQNMDKLLKTVKSFDEVRKSFSWQPAQVPLPSQENIGSPTLARFPISCTVFLDKESPDVKSLFIQYPALKNYWDLLIDIGYRVNYNGKCEKIDKITSWDLVVLVQP